MVQFRVSGKVYPIKDVSVSIPVWYNLESNRQYKKAEELCFNSSVVQFRVLALVFSVIFMLVSIPVWYNLETSAFKLMSNVSPFQFQCGTI